MYTVVDVDFRNFNYWNEYHPDNISFRINYA